MERRKEKGEWKKRKKREMERKWVFNCTGASCGTGCKIYIVVSMEHV